MSGSFPEPDPEPSERRRLLAYGVAYAVLGAALLWSRLLHLGHSFWTDEILMVDAYVRPGPRYIITGPGLSHELMAIANWATGLFVGESEVAFRLWSAVPFITGVVLVTAWLHSRLDRLSGVLFLFLATVSPLLLDVTRQARGYGPAFCAMCVVIVGALEATRSGRREPIVALCIAGVLGAWTLPQVGIAFVATGAALLIVQEIRRPVAIGMAISIAMVAAWYSPHLGAVHGSAQIADGTHFRFPWVVTAPIDQVFLPALIWIDGTVIVAGFVWLPLVLLVVLVAAWSPLARDLRSAAILCAAPAATAVVLWLGNAYVIPRYLSYLLVPLFVLVATGAAAILRRFADRRGAVPALVVLVAIGLLAFRFVVIAPDVVALPREANSNAARVIQTHGGMPPVLTYMRNPQNVAFYLGRPVRNLKTSDVAASVCDQTAAVVYVTQPFAVEDVQIPCLSRPGVQHYSYRQYARGDEMNVWLVPPGS
jgi:hypothetical protein